MDGSSYKPGPSATKLSPDSAVRDALARERTTLANERTLLAYVRTALAVFVVGVSLLAFTDRPVFHATGLASLVVTFAIFAFGFRRFFQVRARIRSDIPSL
jgi:putative membrane protein